MARTCKNCARYGRPAPRKWKKCLDNILPGNQSRKGDCCLWWTEKKKDA